MIKVKNVLKNKFNLTLIILLAILLCCSRLILSFIHKIEYRSLIKVSGNIEATDVRVSFRVKGKIEERYVDEGYIVRPDQLLARLKTDELIRIRDEAANSLKAAEYMAHLAKIDYVRAQNLYEAGAISAQDRDKAQTKSDSMASKVGQLRASLELAETRLGFTNLKSPLHGFVLVKSAEVGEVMQIGATVFTIADLHDIWLTAYINERDLGRVKLNQKAYITTDTYPNKKYPGWVSFISSEAEFTPKQIQTTEERVKLVYRIKIRADNTSLELKPGMPADGYIILKNVNSKNA